MDRANLDAYYGSLSIVKIMHYKGLINDKDYKRAENHLAKKILYQKW